MLGDENVFVADTSEVRQELDTPIDGFDALTDRELLLIIVRDIRSIHGMVEAAADQVGPVMESLKGNSMFRMLGLV